jgi:hypothetical protein
VGGDVRLLYDALHQRTKEGFPSEVSTFFRMQGAFYLSYAPIERVRAYYNQDVNGVRDLWAMVSGALPGRGYVRAGAFRPPYGLRLEDHTIYQRDDLAQAVSVLGYDPRTPDAGIELGWTRTSAFAQASLPNGAGPSFDSDRNKAFTARLGRFHGPLLAGVTVRLDSQGAAAATERRRFGAYGTLTPHPDLVSSGRSTSARTSAAGRDPFAPRGAGRLFFSGTRVSGSPEFLDLDATRSSPTPALHDRGDWCRCRSRRSALLPLPQRADLGPGELVRLCTCILMAPTGGRHA